MISLVTAVPGSGKTLFAITQIDKALSDGRIVYTNIQGLTADKFVKFENLHKAPDDWRDCLDGSLIVYDEAQEVYPATARAGVIGDERLTAMETHRHRGIDLMFITQNPTFLHHHIRKLAGEHIHFYRGRGASRVARYTWSHAVSNPNDRFEQRRADFKIWKFPKKYYSYYSSAVMHTHKFKLPLKVSLIFGFSVVAILALGYRIYDSGGLAIFERF